jgi:hypothetical protein
MDIENQEPGVAVSKIPDPETQPEAFQKHARKWRQPKSKLVAQRRIDELLYQINCLQPLLQDADPDIRLRTSVEIRNLDAAIQTWYLQIQNYKPTIIQRKKPAKKKQVRDMNVFRPL